MLDSFLHAYRNLVRSGGHERIGNDIVSLRDSSLAHRHSNQRYLSKICTEREQLDLANHPQPNVRLWSIWAAKETAYKVSMKLDELVPSIPRLYEVHFGKAIPCRGWVQTPIEKVEVEVHLFEHHLHCIGSSSPHSSLSKVIFGHSETKLLTDCAVEQSRTARDLIIDNLSSAYGISPKLVQIVRPRSERGLLFPLILVNGELLPVDVSISHDGRVSGFAETALQK